MEKYVIGNDYEGNEVTVRELQLELLTIMDEIHRICVKNEIPYALHAGSALGVLNYKGFIPWDDDIDVIVPREYWKKFVDALKSDLKNDFYFQCFETDKKYNVLIPEMKIRKKNTRIEEVNFLLKNRCKGDGIFIDISTYDTVSENKFIDELNRTFIKICMPFLVLLDNLRIPHSLFKRFIRWFSYSYSKRNKNSNVVSQTIAIPWEKFLKEPIFNKEDIYPFKLYEFEGRKYYSYNNIMNVMKKWHGPNCYNKNPDQEWVETLPVEKRKPKHAKYLNLKSDK